MFCINEADISHSLAMHIEINPFSGNLFILFNEYFSLSYTW